LNNWPHVWKNVMNFTVVWSKYNIH
jgi:hypothetical protein